MPAWAQSARWHESSIKSSKCTRNHDKNLTKKISVLMKGHERWDIKKNLHRWIATNLLGKRKIPKKKYYTSMWAVKRKTVEWNGM